MKSKLHTSVSSIVLVVIITTAMLISPVRIGRASAMEAGPHHSFLGGPWELVVKMGLGGEGLRFPLNVSDETKPEKLDAVYPVLSSPIKVRLEQYVPDLAWETVAIKHPGGGMAVRLTIRGKNLEQRLWLSTGDPTKQSVSSRIGSIAVRRLYNRDTAEALVRKLTDPKAVGILSIWSADNKQPFECVAKIRETVTIPDTQYKITVAEYLPHYSIDTETKRVFSQSNEPVNPAVRVILSHGKETVERWLWAKFLSSPHEQEKLPFRMKFTDFDLRSTGSHILTVASRTQVWVLPSGRAKRVEKAEPGRAFPFADKEYSFTVDEILDEAIIKTQWKNNSERLLRPAIVAMVEQDETRNQAVLELNQPFHLRTKSGVLVLLYRRRPASSEAAY